MKAQNSVAKLMQDNDRLIEAMGKAVQQTLREHKLLGYPIVIWRDGKVVWLPPEEIPLDEDKPNGQSNGPVAGS